jgi:CheY-like chemotaxis protein
LAGQARTIRHIELVAGDHFMQRSLEVLVVDDEMLIATAIEDLLSSDGHRVTVALGARDAMDAAGRLTRLDAAVLDLQLPDGSGAELIASIRERFPRVPLVISTGYALDGADRQALDPTHGRTILLKKPWTEEELLSTLASATAA